MLTPANLINIIIVLLITTRGLFSNNLVEILLLGVLMSLFILNFKRIKFTKDEFLLIAIVILIVSLVSINLYFAKNINDLLTYMGYFLVGIMLFLIIKAKSFNLNNLYQFIKTHILVTSIICLYTNLSFILYSFIGYSSITVHVGQTIRAVGLFGNPNYYSMLLLTALGFLLGLKDYKIKLDIKKTTRLFLLFNFAIGIFLTFSRGALITMVIVLIVYIILNYKKFINLRSMISIFFVSILVFIILEYLFDLSIVQGLMEQFIIRLENAIYGTGAGRYHIWDDALELFSQSLLIIIIGVGGNQLYYYNNHNPHNSYIGTLVETGLIGTFLLIILSIFVVSKVFSFTKLKVTSPMFYSLLSMYIMALSNDVFLVKEFWIIVAITVIYSSLLRERNSSEVSSNRDEKLLHKH